MQQVHVNPRRGVQQDSGKMATPSEAELDENGREPVTRRAASPCESATRRT